MMGDLFGCSGVLLGERGGEMYLPLIFLIPAFIFWFWYKTAKHKRLIEDIPTSKTKGVAIGLTEVKGAARRREPLISYLTATRCVWYRYSVEEHWERTTTETYTDSEGKTKTRTKTESGWKTVLSDEVRVLFFVEDDTGSLRIDPFGAKIQGNLVFSETCWQSDPLYYDKGPSYAVSDSTGKRRFTEYAIPIGEALYVMGTARVRSDAVAAEIAHDSDAPMFLISTRDEAQITRGLAIRTVLLAVFGVLTCAGAAGLLLSQYRGQPFDHPEGIQAMVLAGLGYLLLLSAFYMVLLYNGLIRVRERIGKAWSLIEVQLKRRSDLVPRLAHVVKGYADYEREVQEGVSQLRADRLAGRARTPKGQQLDNAQRVADGQTAMLTRVLAVVEAYPELKSSELYLNLQRDLSDTEDRIALARSFYNDTVTAYNERIGTMPDLIFASLMKLGRIGHYQIQAFERRPVDVRLDDADNAADERIDSAASDPSA